MIALVTGGASGLGEAITRALSVLPEAEVIFTYCKSEARARGLEAELGNVRGRKCDFTSRAEVAALAEAIPSLEIDVLVHNAITGFSKTHFQKLNPDDFERNFRDNVMPVIRLTQAALSAFRKRKSGRIITVLSSYVVNRPPLGMSAYVAEKAYLHSLAKSWAVENAAFGITSNCVSPSLMATQLSRDVDERVLELMTSEHPLKRLLTTAEAAQTVAYLAGPASAHMNGANLILNAAADVV